MPMSLPIPLRCDDQATISISTNPIAHDKVKHAEIDCHLVRDLVDEGFIPTTYVPTTKQLADLFTKAKSFNNMSVFFPQMGLISFPDVPSEGEGMLE